LKVNVTLFAYLNKYSSWGNAPFDVELDHGTVLDLITQLGIPGKKVALVMVNGNLEKKSTQLKDGDSVRLFPMVPGG